MSIIIGIDHGYYAIKTAHCSFPAGLTSYGEHEPYTRQGLLEFGGCFFVCGSGRQPSDTVRDIVNKQGRKYTEHLLSATMEAGFDLHAIPAVLLGGGASVVSRHLSPKDGLCKTIFLLDDKVNAGGFERALAAVSRRKSEA